MSEKEAQLVQQLLEKTNAKTIPWDVTARENEFVAPYKGHVTFVISKYENPYNPNGEAFRLVMRDLNDREMLVVESLSSLGQLYYAAHNSALKVEETLDAILDDLRQAS